MKLTESHALFFRRGLWVEVMEVLGRHASDSWASLRTSAGWVRWLTVKLVVEESKQDREREGGDLPRPFATLPGFWKVCWSFFEGKKWKKHNIYSCRLHLRLERYGYSFGHEESIHKPKTTS